MRGATSRASYSRGPPLRTSPTAVYRALLMLLWVLSTESASGSDADSAAESDADAESEPGSVGRFRVLVVSASATGERTTASGAGRAGR